MPATPKTSIRTGTADDLSRLAEVYAGAFPGEDLLPLVEALLAEGSAVISLVAVARGAVVGHILMTLCGVEGQSERVALLGPLAVVPDWQGRGVGSVLVAEGLRRVEAEGASRFQVLGDPAYYGRFGFRADTDVTTPYPIPAEWASAWQSLPLRDGAPAVKGKLVVPGPWREPSLWSPPAERVV